MRGSNISTYPVQKLPNFFPSFAPGPIGFSTFGRRGAHGVARVGTTTDYDWQDYFQILCCGRDIVVTILTLKCRKQKVHCNELNYYLKYFFIDGNLKWKENYNFKCRTLLCFIIFYIIYSIFQSKFFRKKIINNVIYF